MRSRRRRRRKVIRVPVASMGDIAFLLIIFFMITSSFAREASIRLTPPTSPDLDEVESTPVSVSIDEEGVFWVNDDQVADLDALESMVEELLAGATDDAQRLVRFRCDAGIAKDIFEPVLGAITAAGGIVAAVGERAEY